MSDSDDDFDSGIYEAHEALGSAEIDHEGQLELAIADGSEKEVASWTIGEQVPLDSDDDIDSGIYTPHEVFASAETGHEDQLESMADGSGEPVAYWTIGEQVPLDSDDDIDSGTYSPQEAFVSAETDNENQLQAGRIPCLAREAMSSLPSLGILPAGVIAAVLMTVVVLVLAVVLIFVVPTLQTGIERVQTGVEKLQAGFEELLQFSRAFPTLVLLVISSAWILYTTTR